MWTPTLPSLYHFTTDSSVEDMVYIVTLNFYFYDFDRTSHSTPSLNIQNPQYLFSLSIPLFL